MEIIKRLFGKSDNEIKCFEEIENVFQDTNKNYDLVFFPLCSINLSKVIPKRNEWIHFVDVWNNGDIESSFFHQFRTRDLIKFKLVNSKYEYLGNEKAFPKYENLRKWKEESVKEIEANKEQYVKIIEPQIFQNSVRKQKENERQKTDFDYFLYIDQQITYQVTKERFKKSGQIINHKSFPKEYKVKSQNPIKQIGGNPNWIQQDMTPKDKNGKPLTFIGEVTGFKYMKNGSGGIFLFLDELTNEVIEIIQFG